ncbi:hypothetical protein B0H10DRAFT_2265081 [Mycena sp. CBHHK59/15]|nr:hypothetical protein B0H10DRAFT_2265081 [Mycena sp. CBHHK59/15]
MMPEETALLQEVGQALVMDASQVVLTEITYGIYIFTVALDVASLLRRKLMKNPVIWALLVAVGVTFAMTTVYTASRFQRFLKVMHVLFEENTENPLAMRMDLANQSVTGVTREWHWFDSLRGLDWGHCLSGNNMAGNILDMSAPNFITIDSAVGVLTLLGMTLPLATNLLAPGLIAYKAYTYHGFMKATLGLGQSKVAKVLMVVTESGDVCCVIQDINVALNLTNNTNGSLQDQVTQLWNQFTLFVSYARHTNRPRVEHHGLHLATRHSNRVEVEGRLEGKEEGKWERHDVV